MRRMRMAIQQCSRMAPALLVGTLVLAVASLTFAQTTTIPKKPLKHPAPANAATAAPVHTPANATKAPGQTTATSTKAAPPKQTPATSTSTATAATAPGQTTASSIPSTLANGQPANNLGPTSASRTTTPGSGAGAPNG